MLSPWSSDLPHFFGSQAVSGAATAYNTNLPVEKSEKWKNLTEWLSNAQCSKPLYTLFWLIIGGYTIQYIGDYHNITILSKGWDFGLLNTVFSCLLKCWDAMPRNVWQRLLNLQRPVYAPQNEMTRTAAWESGLLQPWHSTVNWHGIDCHLLPLKLNIQSKGWGFKI